MPTAVRSLLFVAGAAVAAFATWVVAKSEWLSTGNVYDQVPTIVAIVGFWCLFAGAVWLYRWRPGGRSWLLVWAMGVVWAAWAAMATTGATWAIVSSPVWLLRPLLFAIILSWPTGRLTRGDAWWLGIYSFVEFVAMTAWIPTQTQLANGSPNPLGIADVPRINYLASALSASLVIPVGAALLVVSVVRRYRLLPVTMRPIHTPVLVAAIMMAVSEALLTVAAYVPRLDVTDPESNWFHGVLVFSNFVPFAVTPAMLALAAHRTTRLAARGERVRHLDIEPGTEALPVAVAAALNDPTAVVAFRRADGTWVDSTGAAIVLQSLGRTTTFIERDGEQIAAVEHASGVDRPTTLELAVAAAGSTIEFERAEAIARSRQAEAVAARRTIVEVQDTARRRLERDLHDGAQQRLVGLALQANMAARQRSDAEAIAAELRSGVAMTRSELHDVATGLLPALVAERGLHASVATLAATAPMAVEIHIDQPARLDPGVAAAAWFVVSEAVANATKHSHAKRLQIVGAVDDGRLEIEVSDDGQGGACGQPGSGLAGLRDRVARAGGALSVDSPIGIGTVVHASFPLVAVP